MGNPLLIKNAGVSGIMGLLRHLRHKPLSIELVPNLMNLNASLEIDQEFLNKANTNCRYLTSTSNTNNVLKGIQKKPEQFEVRLYVFITDFLDYFNAFK